MVYSLKIKDTSTEEILQNCGLYPFLLNEIWPRTYICII